MGAAADGDRGVIHRRRVHDDRPGGGRPERRDRAALVAGDVAGLVGVGQRQALDAEMGAHLRPVEAASAGDEHEHVVVLATPDDDRAQQGTELDPLELGALLGAAGALCPDDAMGDAGGVDRLGRSGRLGHRSSASAGVGLDLEVAAVGEGAHQVAEEAVELGALGVGQDGGDRLLADGLLADSRVPGGVAGLCRFHERASTIRRVGKSTDQPGLLQAIEPIGHGAARKLQVGGQHPGRSLVRRTVAPKLHDEVECPPVEIELGERLRLRLVQTVGEDVDPLDDPLGQRVERRDLAGPDEQAVVEAVEVARVIGWRGHQQRSIHSRPFHVNQVNIVLLHLKYLDIKRAWCDTSPGEIRKGGR